MRKLFNRADSDDAVQQPAASIQFASLASEEAEDPTEDEQAPAEESAEESAGHAEEVTGDSPEDMGAGDEPGAAEPDAAAIVLAAREEALAQREAELSARLVKVDFDAMAKQGRIVPKMRAGLEAVASHLLATGEQALYETMVASLGAAPQIVPMGTTPIESEPLEAVSTDPVEVQNQIERTMAALGTDNAAKALAYLNEHGVPPDPRKEKD